eukprot:3261129-Pyramimonas_sp.AAC.1
MVSVFFPSGIERISNTGIVRGGVTTLRGALRGSLARHAALEAKALARAPGAPMSAQTVLSFCVAQLWGNPENPQQIPIHMLHGSLL